MDSRRQQFQWMRVSRAHSLIILPCFQCKRIVEHNHIGEKFRSFCRTCLPFCGVDGCNCVVKSNHVESILTSSRVLVIGGCNGAGYEISLAYLRSGADVHITTSSPDTLATALSKEGDYVDWSKRVSIIGLDLSDGVAFDEFLQYLHDPQSPQFCKTYYCAATCPNESSDEDCPPLSSNTIPILQFGTKVDCRAFVPSAKRLLTLNVNVSSILAQEMEKIAIKSQDTKPPSLVIICPSSSPDTETDFWLQVCDTQLSMLSKAHPKISVTIQFSAPTSGDPCFSLTPEESTNALLKNEH
jgi:hypothetical protein